MSRIPPYDRSAVGFLNVDVDLYGDFDRAALLHALGPASVVLHEGDGRAGEPALTFESGSVDAPAEETLATLIGLVRALPDEARAAWKAATRRVFDIGIQSGDAPQSSQWRIDANTLRELSELGVDLVVTVYGIATPASR